VSPKNRPRDSGTCAIPIRALPLTETFTGLISFTALRDIRRGEELTVNYCGEPDAVGELWFDAGAPPPA